MNNNLPDIHALWVGSKLGPISKCCLNSFIKIGHNVHLHTYQEIDDLPENIILHNANYIIPEKKIFKHKQTGSYAHFADVFRYKLLEKYNNIIYVDCDVYCLKPLVLPKSNYLFGYEDGKHINNAVLSVPNDSELLNSLLKASEERFFIPPWFSNKMQRRLKLRKSLRLGKDLSELPWGVLGPQAITFYIKYFNLTSIAQPIDILYPLHYGHVNQLIDPNLEIKDIISSRTLCIHLYNEMLKKVDINQINQNSILARMLKNEI